MAEYIERQAAIDLFYPVDPENDGSDGCTVVYKTENYTSDEIEAVISGLPAADVAPVLSLIHILLRVEELAPGIFRGMLAGGAQALAVVREDGRIAVREAEPWV